MENIIMDNPVSWIVLFVLAIIVAVWFAKKCFEELSQKQAENDEYFWKRERNQRRK